MLKIIPKMIESITLSKLCKGEIPIEEQKRIIDGNK